MKYNLALCFLCIIGFVLRIYHLDSVPLWTDESVHGNILNGFFLQNNSLITKDNNGILYTFISLAFVKIFGINEFGLRFGSVVFSTLSIPMIYRLGKQLFNQNIGLIAAFLTTFSFYLVFWGRIGRHYAIFEFFYLLVLFLFWKMWEISPYAQKNNHNTESQKVENPKTSIFTNNIIEIAQNFGVYKLDFIVLIIGLFLCLLANRLTFFFVFSIGLYGSIIAITQIIQKKNFCYSDKYAVLLYGNLLLYFLLLTQLAEYILMIFMPYSHIYVFMPSLDYILQKYNSMYRYDDFDIYYAVLSQDYIKYSFYKLGFIGFILAFFTENTQKYPENNQENNHKSAIYLAVNFILPFLLMSFIFNYMSAERYIIYLYPLFLLSIAITIYSVINLIIKQIAYKILENNIAISIIVVLLSIALFLVAPINDLQKLLTEDKYGVPHKKELAKISFDDWRNACNYVKIKAKPQAVIMSLNTSLANFYFQKDNILQFSQFIYFKGELKQMPSDNGKIVNSYEAFMKLYNTKQEGWLILDSSFYNYYVDTNLREFIIKNLKQHKASKDESVLVYSWNK